VEPHVAELPPALEGRNNVRFAEPQDAIKHADVVVLLVDHQQFRLLPKGILDGKQIVDTKGLWRPGKSSALTVNTTSIPIVAAAR
jgi:UDP-N-acetyl-D-mannosaminuronic acid dehydrogenase